MASRPSARRSALGADLPGDRARRRRGGPYPSRAPHGQSHASRSDWRVPHRSDAGLPRPQRRPLFGPADRRRQGRRTIHRSHATRGGFRHPRWDAGPSAAARAKAGQRQSRGRRPFKSEDGRVLEPGREPACRGEVFQRAERGLVPLESSAGQGRGAEPLSARCSRGGFRQRRQRRPGLLQVCFPQLRSDHQPRPPSGRRMDLSAIAHPAWAGTAAGWRNRRSTTSRD